MSVVIFIIILAVLILVHELGHFIVAKKSGIRVDEFGLGLPPKIFTIGKIGETEYTINAIPFGGFVKIFGENPDEESTTGPDSSRSFVNKPKYIQALVLASGVAFNLIFAWVLISSGFIFGMPTPVDYSGNGHVENAKLVITATTKDSPSYVAGVKSGDQLLSIETRTGQLINPTPTLVQEFVTKHGDEKLTLDLLRGREKLSVSLTPASGVLPNQKAIGVAMDMIGILKLPVPQALWEGGRTTYALAKGTTIGLALFIKNAFVGKSDLSQITGPVGIVGIVGDVTNLGFIYLISFTAFISINLAVINLIPFPALDGGRLLFVLIETIKGSRINPKISNVLNSVGFVFLILLMVVVTFHDILNLIK